MHRLVPAFASAAIVLPVLASGVCAQNIRYVRTDGPVNGDGLSWATAMRNLTQAVATSQPGTAIWVARGTYRPQSVSGITLSPAVSLYGGFVGNETSIDQRDWAINTTILSGDMLADDDIGGTTADNGLVLLAQPNVLANTVVDGFTIRSGRSQQGGAIRCFGSPLIRNCLFTRNNIDVGGVGAAVYLGLSGPPSSPRLINCRFVRNGTTIGSSTGVLTVEGSGTDARVIGCSFIGNAGTGQGIVCIRNGGSATLVNCTVASNTFRGTDGAVFLGSSSPSSLNLINCTIAGNNCTDAGQTAGLRVATPSTPVLVRNCILWGNTSSGTPVERAQFSFPGIVFRLDYCRVQGWSGMFMGTATSAADPLLMDLDGPDDLFGTGDEDVRLLPGSSGIDAANNSYVWPDIADVDGDGNVDEPTPHDASGGPRFLDDSATADTGVGTPPIADIGAYEHVSQAQPCRADFNQDGFADSQDFFDFLTAFFEGCP